MSKRINIIGLLLLLLTVRSVAQSIHLSQYYNAPILITPANTALMPDDDFRIGLNYRNQWSALPVPYNTFAGWGDFKIGGNKDNGHNNWLGLGLSIYSDKAGDGHLKLSQFQGNIAYHLQMSSTSMLSVGLSAASVSRSVNYDLLTFDAQWDGLSFNSGMPTGEKLGIIRTSYYTVGAGANLSFFPNETVYVQLGGGAVNINKPVETFYNNGKNTISLRPSGTLDVLWRTGPALIVNPSVYYTSQSGAMELVGGTQVRAALSSGTNNMPIQLILGGYYRLADAAVFTAGIQYGPVQFMASYDFTMSSLSPYNSSYGAMEFSIIYLGKYGRNRDNTRRAYNCPRFG